MFVCYKCENLFDEPKTVYQYHPYGNDVAEEPWGACPFCGSTEIDEASKCERCGDLVLEVDDMGLCDFCHEEMYG
jgi:hypothetical protein